MRVALGLEYDGRSFEGWQTQPSGQTVQDYLEAAVVQFTGEKVKAVCAGRTDANVHATGQVIHLDTEADRKEFPGFEGLNSYLPTECAVRWARLSRMNFSRSRHAAGPMNTGLSTNRCVRRSLPAEPAGSSARSMKKHGSCRTVFSPVSMTFQVSEPRAARVRRR